MNNKLDEYLLYMYVYETQIFPLLQVLQSNVHKAENLSHVTTL